MPSKSKSQQRFMGMVHQCKKTGKCASAQVKKAADSMKDKDAEDFASTKHKGLPEKVTEKMTFKEYLLEFDIGDHQLQQQAMQNQQRMQQDNEAKNAFGDKMAASSPRKGDIILDNNIRLLVLSGSMDGIMVKELGGNKTGTFPHGTKFKNVGVNKSGKNQFQVIRN